jgi:hypothetical protein
MTYLAIVFHPGPRTLWRTGRRFEDASVDHVLVLQGENQPDPAEVLLERSFRMRFIARIWARAYLRRLRNIRAEIHVLEA